MPSADIIPPKSGIPESEKMLPPLPASAAEPIERRAARVLVPGREVGHGARRPTLLDVLEAARQDPLDLALEAERRAPHDRLVGRVEPVETGLGRRPAPSSAPAPSSSGASADRRRASPGSSRRASSPPASPGRSTMTTMPPTIAATPIRVRPENGMLSPAISAMTPPTMARTPRPVQRPTTLLGFSANQPRLTTCSSSALSKAATSEPNLGRSSGVMKSPSSPRARPRRRQQRRFLGRADRAARVAGALRLDDGIARVGTHVDADLLARQQAAGLLAEGEQPTRREVEHRRRQRAPRRAAVHDHRPRRRGQVGRRGRHQDRRVVEVDRVLAETAPVDERPARQAEQDDRRPDEPDRGVDLARASGASRRARRVAAASTFWSATSRAASKSAARRCGSMSLSKIAWRSAFER